MKNSIKQLFTLIPAFFLGTLVNLTGNYPINTDSTNKSKENPSQNSFEENLQLEEITEIEESLLDKKSPKLVRRSYCNSVPVKVVHREIPIYPEKAKAENITGDVLIRVEVNEEGNVVVARGSSANNPFLQEVAIVAACKTTFSFPEDYKNSIPAPILLTYRFTLD
ncbi:MAG: TonB family protein [Blastocatellia bacterium]